MALNTQVCKPTVESNISVGDCLLELLTWNGSPFKDHWAYFVRSATNPNVGVKIHVTGDVRNGFEFEIKRSENLQQTDDIPSTRTPLQWVKSQYLDQKAMLNNGIYKIDNMPVCCFERSAGKVKAPGKSLKKVGDVVSFSLTFLSAPALPRTCLALVVILLLNVNIAYLIELRTWLMQDFQIQPGKKVALRDCQTWILDSANQLVEDKILSPEVASYLHTIKQ